MLFWQKIKNDHKNESFNTRFLEKKWDRHPFLEKNFRSFNYDFSPFSGEQSSSLSDHYSTANSKSSIFELFTTDFWNFLKNWKSKWPSTDFWGSLINREKVKTVIESVEKKPFILQNKTANKVLSRNKKNFIPKKLDPIEEEPSLILSDCQPTDNPKSSIFESLTDLWSSIIDKGKVEVETETIQKIPFILQDKTGNKGKIKKRVLEFDPLSEDFCYSQNIRSDGYFNSFERKIENCPGYLNDYHLQKLHLNMCREYMQSSEGRQNYVFKDYLDPFLYGYNLKNFNFLALDEQQEFLLAGGVLSILSMCMLTRILIMHPTNYIFSSVPIDLSSIPYVYHKTRTPWLWGTSGSVKVDYNNEAFYLYENAKAQFTHDYKYLNIGKVHDVSFFVQTHMDTILQVYIDTVS